MASPPGSPIPEREESTLFSDDDDEEYVTPSPFSGTGGGEVFFTFGSSPESESSRDFGAWSIPIHLFKSTDETPSPVIPDSVFFTPLSETDPRVTFSEEDDEEVHPGLRDPEDQLTKEERDALRLEREREAEKTERMFRSKEGGETFEALPRSENPRSPIKKNDVPPQVSIILPPIDTPYGGGEFVVNIKTQGINPSVTGKYFIEILPSIYAQSKGSFLIKKGMTRGVYLFMQSGGRFSNQLLVTVPKEGLNVLFRVSPSIMGWKFDRPKYRIRGDEAMSDPTLSGAPNFDVYIRVGSSLNRPVKHFEIDWNLKKRKDFKIVKCRVCEEPTIRRCNMCKNAWYCGKECMTKDGHTFCSK